MSEGFKKAPYGENQLSLLRFFTALSCTCFFILCITCVTCKTRWLDANFQIWTKISKITLPTNPAVYLSSEAGYVHHCDRIPTACPHWVIQHQQCSHWFWAQTYTFVGISLPKVIYKKRIVLKTTIYKMSHNCKLGQENAWTSMNTFFSSSCKNILLLLQLSLITWLQELHDDKTLTFIWFTTNYAAQ